MAKPKKWLLTAAAACLILIVAGALALQGLPTARDFTAQLTANDPLLAMLLPNAAQEAPTQTDPDYALADLSSLYHHDRLGEVATLLVDTYEDGAYTLTDFENPAVAADIKLPVIVREGTDRGSIKWEGLGYSAVAANATLEVRGIPKANRLYHNFKLRLEDAAGQYEGQSILNLKKSYNKPCRVDEKFAFDLFSTLPDMLSLRTKFVHLYVQDTTAPNPGYADYGLYTLVEQPDESYFTNRGLDDSGNMYQAEDFDFSLHPDLKQVSDPSYNKKAFELVLDIKQGDSHENLLEMLAAVNNEATDIDQVVDSYFDRENLLTWLAMNAVLANADCVTSSYMLYKPSLSAKWFFLPGNMSDAMPAGGDDQVAEVMVSGYSMFYGNMLYERFLQKPENRQALAGRVDALMETFSGDYVRKLTDQYIPVLAKYLVVNPDLGTLKAAPAQVMERVNGYHANLLLNVETFHSSLLTPRRVELLAAAHRKDAVVLAWQPSRQLGGGPLTYTVEVATDPAFTTLVEEATVTDATEVQLKGLPTGQLYWRVTVTDAEGLQAGSTNITELEDGSLLYGAATMVVF